MAVSRGPRRFRARGAQRNWGAPKPKIDVMSIDVAELLGRPTVNLDTPELQRFIAGKTILVTGAGGSIGSEICRQIMRFCPARLILLEQAENALYDIDCELRNRWIGSEIHPRIADICDAARVDNIFTEFRPQVVFHCAAHKHVPMMELNPGEAIKNNIFGTKTVADIAAKHAAHAFVLISSDKAVNPTSVMGATKRVAELYTQWLSTKSKTRFVAVRFGNVLASSGSVVPLFKKQIAAGGPVTVTHPDMQRYFMTIPEASQLVLQAGAIGQGGEIFVLDMGDPVKILDLAQRLIAKAGLKKNDIEIQFTGIRPGEKLFEELARDDERTLPTTHPKIRIWQLARATDSQINHLLNELSQLTNAAPMHIGHVLRRIVSDESATAIVSLRLASEAA